MRTPKIEQETTICIDPVTQKARIYTCMPSVEKKLMALFGEGDMDILSHDKWGLSVSVPMSWIKISRPRKSQYTEEQRAAMRERLAKAREKLNKEKEA